MTLSEILAVITGRAGEWAVSFRTPHAWTERGHAWRAHTVWVHRFWTDAQGGRRKAVAWEYFTERDGELFLPDEACSRLRRRVDELDEAARISP